MHDTVLRCRTFVNCMRLLCCAYGLDSSSMNGLAGYVQQIQTNDAAEARRSRYAQYRGQVATLTFGLATVRGMVQSVREDNSCTPVRWLVTIVPKERRERL
jgi:hypothetical protein